MELGLKGKIAMVTGAGSQIGYGKGIALTLAREGCDVVVADIDLEGAKQTVAEITATGRQALAAQTDVTNSAAVGETVKAALDKFGRIDILVNNAGAMTPPKPFIEKTEAEWDKDINLNLRGVLACTKAVLGQMLARKSGKIVNISSVAAKIGGPSGDVYAAAKAGVVGFTKSLACEVISSGINVNAVLPGLGMTNFVRNERPEMLKMFLSGIPSGRANTPQDIANLVVFLASDVSSNIVGQAINVDGGLCVA